MKTTMVIPSYWARPRDIGWQTGDAVYDHPTPLDEAGTLRRAIDSLEILDDQDFSLVIIAVPTSDDIITQVDDKVQSIVNDAALSSDIAESTDTTRAMCSSASSSRS